MATGLKHKIQKLDARIKSVAVVINIGSSDTATDHNTSHQTLILHTIYIP